MVKMNVVEIKHHNGRSGIESRDYSAPHPPLTLHESDLLDSLCNQDPTGYSG
jgi:hypothetical protein